jgi:hypothetical protein
MVGKRNMKTLIFVLITIALSQAGKCSWARLDNCASNLAKDITKKTVSITKETVNGVVWTVEKVGDVTIKTSTQISNGVIWTVEKAGDVTTWTRNITIEGYEWTVKKTGDGLVWTTEQAIDNLTYSVKRIKKGSDWVTTKTHKGTQIVVRQSKNGYQYVSKKVYKGGKWVVVKSWDGLEKIGEDGWEKAQNSLKLVSDVVEMIFDPFGEVNACGLWNKKDGSREDKSKRFMTTWAIPDYFPSDELSTHILTFGATAVCSYNVARLYHACKEHDRCLNNVEEDGRKCDEDLLEGWENECRDTYAGSWSENTCRQACLAQVRGSYNILQFKNDNDLTKEFAAKMARYTLTPTIITPLLLN